MNAQDHKHALPPRFRLGSYRVLRVLGTGGFGVTYLCEHGSLGVAVAVKEYLPNDIAVRTDTAVAPKSAADREGYQWGLSRFLDEARTLARFQHRNVVRVRDCFEANGTAYIVMDYEDGEPLDRVLERTGTLTEAQIKRLLMPIVAGLRQVHAAGFLHRDVKPANIFIRRSDESPVLLDFGSARQALGNLSRSVTAMASAGYSPPEQYESDGEPGPWTDIYALSALCYRAVTGRAPVEATRRQSRLLRGEDDPLPRLAEVARGRCSQAFLGAVDRGLRVLEAERQGSLDEWWAELEDRAIGQATSARAGPDLSHRKEPIRPRSPADGSNGDLNTKHRSGIAWALYGMAIPMFLYVVCVAIFTEFVRLGEAAKQGDEDAGLRHALVVDGRQRGSLESPPNGTLLPPNLPVSPIDQPRGAEPIRRMDDDARARLRQRYEIWRQREELIRSLEDREGDVGLREKLALNMDSTARVFGRMSDAIPEQPNQPGLRGFLTQDVPSRFGRLLGIGSMVVALSLVLSPFHLPAVAAVVVMAML